MSENMSIESDMILRAARRCQLACSCAGNTVPCTKCWEAGEADVDGYYRAKEEEEARIERLYRQYSETGKKLEP